MSVQFGMAIDPRDILVPFSIPPSMSVSTVANNRLCSCFVVQSIPTAGSIWVERRRPGVSNATCPLNGRRKVCVALGAL